MSQKQFLAWWMGRLLPREDLLPDFMKHSEHKDPKVPERCYRRAIGTVFLGREFKPTTEKQRLNQNDASNNSALKALKDGLRDENLKLTYALWIQACHKAFDDEVVFDKESAGAFVNTQDGVGYTPHKSVQVGGTLIEVGGHIKIFDESGMKLKCLARVQEIRQSGRFEDDKIEGSLIMYEEMDNYGEFSKNETASLSGHTFQILDEKEMEDQIQTKSKHKIVAIEWKHTDKCPKIDQLTAGDEIRKLNLKGLNSSKDPVRSIYSPYLIKLDINKEGDLKSTTYTSNKLEFSEVEALTRAGNYIFQFSLLKDTEVICESRNEVRVDAANVTLMKLNSDISFQVPIGESLGPLSFDLFDKYNNPVHVTKAILSCAKIATSTGSYSPNNPKFWKDGKIANRMYMDEISPSAGNLGKWDLNVTIQSTIECHISFTVSHGHPDKLHLTTDGLDLTNTLPACNFSNIPTLNFEVHDSANNVCKDAVGYLILHSQCWRINESDNPSKISRVGGGISEFKSADLQAVNPVYLSHEMNEGNGDNQPLHLDEIVQRQGYMLSGGRLTERSMYFQPGDDVMVLFMNDSNNRHMEGPARIVSSEILRDCDEGLNQFTLCIQWYAKIDTGNNVWELSGQLNNCPATSILRKIYVLKPGTKCGPLAKEGCVIFCENAPLQPGIAVDCFFAQSISDSVNWWRDFSPESRVVHRRFWLNFSPSRNPHRLDLQCNGNHIAGKVLKVNEGACLSVSLRLLDETGEELQELSEPCSVTLDNGWHNGAITNISQLPIILPELKVPCQIRSDYTVCVKQLHKGRKSTQITSNFYITLNPGAPAMLKLSVSEKRGQRDHDNSQKVPVISVDQVCEIHLNICDARGARLLQIIKSLHFRTAIVFDLNASPLIKSIDGSFVVLLIFHFVSGVKWSQAQCLAFK